MFGRLLTADRTCLFSRGVKFEPSGDGGVSNSTINNVSLSLLAQIDLRISYGTEVPLYSPATATAFRFALVVRLVRPPPTVNQASV